MPKLEVGDIVRVSESWLVHLAETRTHETLRPHMHGMFFVEKLVGDESYCRIRPMLSKESFHFTCSKLKLVEPKGPHNAQDQTPNP